MRISDWSSDVCSSDLDLRDHKAFFLPSATLGLRVLLAAITVLFSLLLVAYHDRMMMGGDWRALPDPWLLWPNTVVLIVSSISLQWASLSARRGEIRGIRRGLRSEEQTSALQSTMRNT